MTGSGAPTAAGGSGSKDKLAMGVLQTGYLIKTNPYKTLDRNKKRFVVLTHVGFHWFKVSSAVLYTLGVGRARPLSGRDHLSA
jgi:hypothetical protein